MRGLVITHNASGKLFHAPDLQRWMRICRLAFKTEKIDVLAGPEGLRHMPALLETARELDARISLRTEHAPPRELGAFAAAGLFDVFAEVRGLHVDHLESWFRACRAAKLPLRLQVFPPFAPGLNPNAEAARLAAGGVMAVNLAFSDPFTRNTAPPLDAGTARTTIDLMARLALAFDAHGIEANLPGMPFCWVEEAARSFCVPMAQFHHDHQHYENNAYALAQELHAMGPMRARIVLFMLLARYTSYPNPIDSILLPWLTEHPWARARVWAWHKVSRYSRFLPHAPRALVETPEAHEAERTRREAGSAEALGPECGACSLRRICDHAPEALRRRLPGVEVRRIEGENVCDPHYYTAQRRRYYDAVDQLRRERGPKGVELAARANALVAQRRPDIEIDSFAYRIEGQWTWQLAGTVRWFSWTNTEKTSTPLARLEPPFTLAATFGGGFADYVGFSLGRHARLVCPMIAASHRMILHVEADGRYVLLRDGASVEPMEFAGQHCVPSRLGGRLEPRLSIWNIDGVIGTQGVSIWRGGEASASQTKAEYSVLIVSTRYARRLQAALQGIAHQRGILLERIEVIIAYVPGIDATGDVIESIEAAHPALRIVRAPFADGLAMAKGFLINESARMASGNWVVLLDADIILPPAFFAALDALPPEAAFAIPDGRKMLPADTTARILLGEIQPWECWEELLAGPGEYRRAEAEGVPIGFCQCVRKECFEAVRYEEMNHFEGADWKFGNDMRARFGQERRLSGLPTLHLDHAGSQWYGTPQHR